MYTKAVDLKEFYDTTQGRMVQRILRQRLRALWPNVKGRRMAAVGYALPCLKPFAQEAERIVALMPRQQGAVFWPPEKGGLTTLCDEGQWPIETNSIDSLLVMHGTPGHESLDAVLREAWRILTGQGSLILIVPNRSGLWARFDHTPFGHGAPYSMGQMKSALKDYMFMPERMERALFVPPSVSPLMLVTAPLWERLGRRFFNAFGGVNIIEATKQLYAGTPVGVAASTAETRRFVATPRPLSRVGKG
jgi:hypothetical protein